MRKISGIFVFTLLAGQWSVARSQDAQYMSVNQLRDKYIKAQRDYIATNPNLEAHVLTAPKQQVLQEISESEAAAQNFTSSQQQYFAHLSEEFKRQLDSLRPGATAGDTRILADQMKGMVDRQLDALDNDQAALRSRLNAMNAPGVKLTPAELLIQDRLKKEYAENEAFLAELSRQNRELEKLKSSGDMETTRIHLSDVYTRLAQNADAQRLLAEHEESIMSSYYSDLRKAVDKRPDGGVSSGATGGSRATTVGVSASSQDVPFSVHFMGTWTLPDRVSPDKTACILSASELKIERADKAETISPGKPNISGKLHLSFKGDCEVQFKSTAMTLRNVFKSSTMTSWDVPFAGSTQGREADLSVSSSKGHVRVQSIKFVLFEENRANVTIEFVLYKEDNATIMTSPGIDSGGTLVFQRTASPTTSGPARGPMAK